MFDINCLIGIERIEIEGGCFRHVNQFVLDGLNALRSIYIERESFKYAKEREGSQFVIMNCDQLSEIQIGAKSFKWFEKFQLKNLSSLKSIHLGNYSFYTCHSVVFESMMV